MKLCDRDMNQFSDFSSYIVASGIEDDYEGTMIGGE